MKLKIGDYVQYSFPDAENQKVNVFSGKIHSISENYIVLRNEKNVQVKISFKNFDLIKLLKNRGRKPKNIEDYCD
jgi:small-conductance mechanosensitive channel